ncbi:MAG: ROK family protein, partial [Bacteroidales bacterium]
ELVGYGIGAPMGNIYKGIMERPSNLPWKGILPLAGLFSEHTSLPVTVSNDANAAAMGEMIYGGARGMKNFVVITLGSGLGSGFVIDGRPVYGASGFAGELGHTAVRQGSSGRICGCGRKGCLETYVSGPGISRTVLKIMADSITDSPLREANFKILNSKIIYEAALSKDPIALQAFEYTGKILGCKLADVVALTDPEAVFLFGGLAEAGDLIFGPTRKSMEENLLGIYRGRVKLLPSQLSTHNAALLGAASLVWSKK